MKADIKGLTKLANVLKRLPRKQFDMETWWKKTPCGTAGCIAGWAATVFPSRFKRVDGYPMYNETNGSMTDITGYDIQHRSSGARGEMAFANAFRISEEDAENLTLEDMSTKRTPKAAAKAVMLLVGKLKKELKAK